VQGENIWTAVETVLQSGVKPGTVHIQYYTHPSWIDKDNASTVGTCFQIPK
jgi:hypothetical protein